MDILAKRFLQVMESEAAGQNPAEVLNRDGQRSFAKLQKLVDKFNALRQDAIELTGSEDDIYYDNSSTFDSGPEYIGAVSVAIRDGAVVMSYETEEVHGWSMRRERKTWDSRAPINEGEFDPDILKDELKYMSRCVKRAMTYFRKVNPDMTDDDIEKMFNNDSAIDVVDAD